MPLVQADARAIPLENQSVQCVITSPPYWGLRDYGQAGQLGLEKTPEEYVEKMVEVFREVWRVLRDDGTCWLVMGDSFASGDRSTYCSGAAGNKRHQVQDDMPRPKTPPGLKPKDLCMIPARVALALQADGWYLRSDIIWAKGISFRPDYSGSVMPESMTDRPTQSYEHVFLLTKKAKYYYDMEAVKEQGSVQAGTRAAKGSNVRSELKDVNSRAPEYWDYTGTRNLRSVWAIGTKPFKAAHFATFPPKLVEPCIKAGTSEKGCCAACGAPWVRVVERIAMKVRPGPGRQPLQDASMGSTKRTAVTGTMIEPPQSKTTGWRPSCACPDPSPLPCLVLDPFAGSGTVGLVCRDLGRFAVCCDLKLDYLHMARERIK